MSQWKWCQISNRFYSNRTYCSSLFKCHFYHIYCYLIDGNFDKIRSIFSQTQMFNNPHRKRKTQVFQHGNLCTIVYAASRSRKIKVSAKRLAQRSESPASAGVSTPGITELILIELGANINDANVIQRTMMTCCCMFSSCNCIYPVALFRAT